MTGSGNYCRHEYKIINKSSLILRNCDVSVVLNTGNNIKWQAKKLNSTNPSDLAQGNKPIELGIIHPKDSQLFHTFYTLEDQDSRTSPNSVGAFNVTETVTPRFDIDYKVDGVLERRSIIELYAKENIVQGPFIHPSHLIGINDYITDARKTFFCWRWFKRDNVDFRVITLEEGASNHHVQQRDPYIRPLDLVGTDGYSDNISNTLFCWRWVKRENVDFRVLTIENDPKTHALNPQFLPLQLQGINGYADAISNLKFCWRWFKRENVDFRYVTLE